MMKKDNIDNNVIRDYLENLQNPDVKKIYFGRGGPIHKYPGNVNFLSDVVDPKYGDYQRGNNARKEEVVRDIVHELEANGWRFVHLSAQNNVAVEGEPLKYYDRVGVVNETIKAKIRRAMTDTPKRRASNYARYWERLDTSINPPLWRKLTREEGTKLELISWESHQKRKPVRIKVKKLMYLADPSTYQLIPEKHEGEGISCRRVRSQSEVKERFLPCLRSKGKIFHQQQKIFIRKARKGESLAGPTSGGEVAGSASVVEDDTSFVACDGDNGEYTILKQDEFEKRFGKPPAYAIGESDTHPLKPKLRLEGFLEYSARREVLVQQVSAADLQWFSGRCPLDKGAAFFEAPWGRNQRIEEGDYLVAPTDYNQVYRVDYGDFHKTYTPQQDLVAANVALERELSALLQFSGNVVVKDDGDLVRPSPLKKRKVTT